MTRIRLFHNNTVRTIAPEYQWAVSPDGTQILIGAERDGNTVSPARGVYAIDLKNKVTKAAVLARLNANLKTETALKTAGTRAFQPIAADVRRVLAGVSEARVFGYEKALFDFDSKHISKPGNRLASEYLFNTYTSFGYAPEYQWFEPRAALDGKTANVIATLRGTVNPELVYVVSSHFDSVEAGPGADDDTSGTAALLEAARVLAGHPMPATIVFASFTGEEGGLLGSREFVRRARAGKMKVVGALNNDMIGWTNDHRLDNTIRYSNPGIRDIQHAAAMLFTRLITYDALYFKGTDAVSLYDGYGDVIGGIGSYPVLASPHYHQASDLLEHENHQLITETSKTTVATMMLLASSPSRLRNLKVDSYTGRGRALVDAGPGSGGVTSYIVAHGTAADPLRHRLVVTQPRVTLPSIAAGSVVSVKAVNARGLEGWDWARVTLGARPCLLQRLQPLFQARHVRIFGDESPARRRRRLLSDPPPRARRRSSAHAGSEASDCPAAAGSAAASRSPRARPCDRAAAIPQRPAALPDHWDVARRQASAASPHPPAAPPFARPARRCTDRREGVVRHPQDRRCESRRLRHTSTPARRHARWLHTGRTTRRARGPPSRHTPDDGAAIARG